MANENERIYQTNLGPHQGRRRGGNTVLLIVTIAWALGVSAGLFWIWQYAHDPGFKPPAPVRWPESSQITRPSDRPILLFFAHPRCPCTRAAIRELERLTARVHANVETRVIFSGPFDVGHDWSWTDLRRTAQAIHGVQIVADPDGSERKLFRAQTSGLTVLYSAAGQLLFHGGITASRGHEGDNDGVAALESIILTGTSSIRQTPVYGCPLQLPDQIVKRDSPL